MRRWDGYLREETGKSWGKWAEPKKLCLDTQALCAGPGLWRPADPTTLRHNPQWQPPWWGWTQTSSQELWFYSFPGKLSGHLIGWITGTRESPWAAEELPPSLDVRGGKSRALSSSIVYQGALPRDRKGLEVLDRQNYKPSLRVPTWVVVTKK